MTAKETAGGTRTATPVRDRDSSSYIATFEPAAVFADFVQAEGICTQLAPTPSKE